MNNDLISRSALLEQECFMDDDNGFRCSVVLSADVRRAPAVDAETVCEQMGLVKEALEMAKADLVAVVRCGLCKHWDKEGLYCHHPAGLSFCGKTGAQKGFCYFGERRADDGTQV